jgi:hypothetical protein
MKEGSLFVLFVLIRSTERGMLQIVFLVSLGKLSREGGSALFHGGWACGVEVLEY